MLLNENNPGITLENKIMELRYHFLRKYVANFFAEARKVHTRDNFADPFTKPLVDNE